MRNDEFTQTALTEQFREGIRVIADLTQSINDLQQEVVDHSNHILQAKSELLVLKESAVIQIQTKLEPLEQQQRDGIEDRREGKSRSTTIWIAIFTTVAAIISALLTILLPMALK